MMRVSQLTDEQRATAPVIAALVDALIATGGSSLAFVHTAEAGRALLALGCAAEIRLGGCPAHLSISLDVGAVKVTALVAAGLLPELRHLFDPFASVASPEERCASDVIDADRDAARADASSVAWPEER